jgi:hypothetical protein
MACFSARVAAVLQVLSGSGEDRCKNESEQVCTSVVISFPVGDSIQAFDRAVLPSRIRAAFVYLLALTSRMTSTASLFAPINVRSVD